MIKSYQIVKSFAVIVALTFIFSSCSKNKDNTPAAEIVGTWTISNATLTATVNGQSLTNYFLSLGSTQTEADQFAQALDAALQQSFTGTIEVKSGNTYTATIAGSAKSGTWSINSTGDKLTLDPGTADEATYDILQLDAHNLHLNFTTSEQQDLNNDGTPETITLGVDMTLTK